MAADSKSPADLKKEGEELKSLFAKVKKKQHNCAILMAKDGVVIEAHIKKSPEILLKSGKKNGGMPKGAWGTMTMDGQVIKVDPINDKVPGNLAKLAKKYFSARGLKLRLEILEPEEAEDTNEDTVAEAPESGHSGASEEGATDSAEGEDPKEALGKRMEAMQTKILVLQADTENVMFSALQDGLAAFKRAMDGEDYERGANTLNNLDGVLEDYAGILAEKEPLQARMDAMAAAIERVKKGDNSEAADQIGRIGREFDYALANNEWIGAAERLDVIEKLVEEHGGPAEEEEEEATSETSETAESDASGETTSSPSADDTPTVEVDPEEVQSEIDERFRAELEKRLESNKKEVNGILRKKDSENGKIAVEAITAYSNAMKRGKFPAAEDALDSLDDLLEKDRREFSLNEKQREAIMKALDKMEAELDSLADELAE